MKTIILVAHPDEKGSATQAFLKTSSAALEGVTWRNIDEQYAAHRIDVAAEQALLRSFDRVILQFPMYWYSSPASLKQYMDDVFTRNYVVANHALKNKDLGIVLTIGDSLAEFNAGGAEHFTISELMRPFEAFANKAGMTYLKPFVIAQFGYQDENQKQRLLVDYLQYLSAKMPLSFANRESWLVAQLEKMAADLPSDDQQSLNLVIETIKNQQDQLEDLKLNVKMIRDQEE